MAGMFGGQVPMGQANGPDVDLVVRGTEYYATYETPDGYPAVYDDLLGLFCYALVVSGEFRTTGVPVTEPPPPGMEPHANESDDVRMRKIAERELQLRGPSRNTPQ